MSLRSFLMTAALAATIGGCSGDSGSAVKVPVFKVTGKVTMLGKPISGALIGFAPKETEPFAMGRTNSEGVYTLTTYEAGDGAAKGDYTVTVAKPVVSTTLPPPPTGPTHGADGVVKMTSHAAKGAKTGAINEGGLIPDAYSSSAQTPLKFSVEAKDNVYDIEIK
jgi:hypothetical protein